MITMHSFRAALRAMRSIKRSEVSWMCDLDWQEFTGDPCGFWDTCSETTAYVFWSIICARNTPAPVRIVKEMAAAREAAEKEAR